MTPRLLLALAIVAVLVEAVVHAVREARRKG